MFCESKLNVQGRTLNVARGPASGPPLLLLHGVTRRWQDFSPVLTELSSRFEIFALDFRGHGQSDRAIDYRVIDYCADAVAVMQNVVGAPAVVYGHSLGAMVAAVVAAQLPRSVRAVVLEDPPWQTLGEKIGETSFYSFFTGMQQVALRGGTVDELARAMANIEVRSPQNGTSVKLGEVRDPVTLRFGAACLAHVDPKVFEPIVAGQWLEGYEQDAILDAIACPTLLLQADWAAGGMLPEADATRAEKLIANCARVRLDKIGHLMHWLAREQVLSLVNAFLGSLD